MDNEYVKKYYETNLEKLETSEKVMNIMMFSSQEQYDYIYVVMASLIANNPDLTVHLFIVSFQELVGTEQFNTFFEENGNILTYYLLDDNYVLPFKKDAIHTRTGLGGLIRPIAHTIIEPQYDRILFMDADVVVLGDIYTDFYNLDFEDKYLIVPANHEDYEKYNRLSDATVDYNKAIQGSYFNSAILVLNLKKLRLDMPYDYVLNIANSNDFIKNEQQILNVMLAGKSKYVDPSRFHCRWSLIYKVKSEEEFSKLRNEIAIFHYDPLYVPYKSWDILFEDDEIYSKIRDYPVKAISSPYRFMVVNKKTNEMMKLWWDYAKKTPHYDKFYQKMKIIREYFSKYLPGILNSRNRCMFDIEKIRQNVNTDENSSISEIQRKEKVTWLNAVNIYYGLPQCDYSYDINYNTTDLEQYFSQLEGNNDLVIIITSSITSHDIVNQIAEKHMLGLNEKPKENEGYLAIIDEGESILIEKVGTGILKESYTISTNKKESIKITANGITMNIEQSAQNVNVLVKSEGYNPKTLNSYNSIMINNIEYTQSIRGINIVVYSKEKNMVVDKCFVNNSKLQLRR